MKNDIVIRFIRDELLPFKPMGKLLSLYADDNGTVLNISGDAGLIAKFDRLDMRVGASLGVKTAGINAVSLSKLLHNRVIVRGPEHDLSVFVDWTCLCSPVRRNNRIVGFAGLEERLDSYKLAAREKQIARLWLENKSVMYIAVNLGIREGTVRNVLKTIYRKSGVYNKGSFYRKFLLN